MPLPRIAAPNALPGMLEILHEFALSSRNFFRIRHARFQAPNLKCRAKIRLTDVAQESGIS